MDHNTIIFIVFIICMTILGIVTVISNNFFYYKDKNNILPHIDIPYEPYKYIKYTMKDKDNHKDVI